MAATIASTAILISAQTAPLARDMRTAAKIVGDGTDKMKQEVDRKGTLWGSFFRGAFAIAMFNRLVRNIREGVKAMQESGDAGAEAAAKGLKQYDDAIKRIQISIAKALIPAVSKLGEGIADTVEAVEDLVDIWQFMIVSGKGEQGLIDELGRRARIQDELTAKNAKMAADLEKADAQMKTFVARAAKIKPLFDQIADPLQKHLDLVKEINTLVEDQGAAAKMVANEFDKLQSKLGIAPELSAFEKFTQVFENLHAVRRAGLLDEIQFARLLGQQVEKLAVKEAAQQTPPEALMRGSAAAFSAINAFQRGTPDTKMDAAAAIERAAKEQAERDREQIRLGKEANKHLQKFAEIEVMAP